MYPYRGDALSSQRSHHPSHPPLPVQDPINTHHQTIGYIPSSSLPPPPQHQIARMPHRQDEPSDTMVPTGDGPEVYRTVYDGKIWELQVVQQPIRARMCGFGDKDRRPITPPPCVKLTIRDEHTKEEIPFNDIDTSFFVLTVDLWDASGTEEQNLVKNPANSPSIGTASAISYPSYSDGAIPPSPSTYIPGPPNGYANDPRYPPPGGSSHYNAYGAPPPPSYTHPAPNGYPYSPGYPPPSPYHPGPMTPGGPYSHQIMPPPMQPRDVMTTQPSQTPPQYNRNLIGSLSASAFQLTDTQGRPGIWFIMQDLSVRQEGTFRLKMSFVDVGDGTFKKKQNSKNQASSSSSTGGGSGSNGLRKTAPVLASCFSDAFQVFSAKRFPGVIESTPLSKCFANQGIKIPIRQNDSTGNNINSGNHNNNHGGSSSNNKRGLVDSDEEDAEVEEEGGSPNS